jgi:triacylglycerol lipase
VPPAASGVRITAKPFTPDPDVCLTHQHGLPGTPRARVLSGIVASHRRGMGWDDRRAGAIDSNWAENQRKDDRVGVSAFNQQANEYSLEHAYWLGRAARLAYGDESEILADTEKWGFDQLVNFRGTHQMPFPLEDTQAYLAASDRMIVVAFRGTEPSQIRDWLSDSNTPVIPGPAKKGLVHLGFSRALASVYPEIRNKVAEVRTNNQTLWFTGHSLGGALAMLAGATMHLEDPKLLADGVYTFGQPRTCDRLFAAAHDTAFASRHFRFVNNNDIVAQVPPEPAFHHVNAMMYFDANGKLHEKMPFVSKLTDSFKGFTSDPFAPGTDGIRDHSMDTYVMLIEKNLG